MIAFLPAAWASATLCAMPPVAERLPANQQVAATDLEGAVLSTGCGALDDAFAALAGPNASGVPTLVSWRLDSVSGAWSYEGAVAPAGMPALGVTSPSQRFVVTDRSDTLAFRLASSTTAVIRRAGGTWEYRGSISPGFAAAPIAVDGDTLVFGGTTVRVARRDATGNWSVVSSTPASTLGAVSFATAKLDGDWALLGSSGWPLRMAVARIEPSGLLTPLQVIQAPHPMPWLFASSIAASHEWVAVTARSTASASLGMAIYRRNADGTLVLSQWEPGAEGVPVQIQGERLLTTSAFWARDAAGIWHRGAFLADAATVGSTEAVQGYRQAIAGDGSVLVRSDPPTLLAWDRSSTDCNGNGMLDAVEIAQGLATDCNRNGVPDSCDVQLGLLADGDLNGVPDACESDCDGNGVPDLTQIRAGAPTDCRDDAVLASCAIASGAPDVDGDGRVDACGPDADSNGAPDALDIAAGNAIDCDGDGLSDAAPLQRIDAAWEGPGGQTIGAAGALLATAFPSDPSGRFIGAVGIRIQRAAVADGGVPGCTPVNQPIRAAIALDPNGDGHPSDAVVVATAAGIASDSDWQVLRFEPVEITTPSFFAIVTLHAAEGSSCIDVDFNLGNCEQGACGRLFGSVLTAVPAVEDLEGITRTTTRASNGQVVPMAVFAAPCGDVCDFNGDGFVNGADLGALLAAWGPAQGSVCDVNYDNSVDGADLGVLLSRWGAARDR